MKPTYDNAAEFAADVTKHAKTGWVNGTYQVGASLNTVGIKAHRKWVQRIQRGAVTDSGEFSTQRDMRAFITEFCK